MSDIDNKLADEIYRVLIGYKCATQIADDLARRGMDAAVAGR